MMDVLATKDVIVNAVLQNPNAPLTYVTDEDVNRLKRNTLIVDVSCDEGMGFTFAKPTTMDAPTFTVGSNDRVTYYSIDHTPSLLWDSASWEISKVVLDYLPVILGGGAAWQEDVTIAKAIDIHQGMGLNPAILKFQKRGDEFPHGFLAVDSSAANISE